eukprot:Protomagalhaensia_sp_Gyna_25__5767@NODE_838_length_2526_cov_1214_098512_g660_i0_p3_GENE_NODE_838_length_2526_cov_1214_098512_g660_i0NODE_838_length_2526_cov_1214_098512_g660_i0_p3_ORF_typecomplete_len180_score19_95MATH/PF00917_26/0_00094_NODE_838_length_2526_cov_1214_098512_g660_i019202459
MMPAMEVARPGQGKERLRTIIGLETNLPSEPLSSSLHTVKINWKIKDFDYIAKNFKGFLVSPSNVDALGREWKLKVVPTSNKRICKGNVCLFLACHTLEPVYCDASFEVIGNDIIPLPQFDCKLERLHFGPGAAKSFGLIDFIDARDAEKVKYLESVTIRVEIQCIPVPETAVTFAITR